MKSYLSQSRTAKIYAGAIIIFAVLYILACAEDRIFDQGGRFTDRDLVFLLVVVAGGLLVCWITSLLARAVAQIIEWRNR